MDTCRILVTVLQCFEIFLLSPNLNRQQWYKRIRYRIFDEIHCITNENGASA
jgi:hypothetical protein